MKRLSKSGFTLIELVVTIAISSIFFTMAMNLYSTANRAFVTDEKYDELYFEYNVLKAKTVRFLQEHPERSGRSSAPCPHPGPHSP